MGKDRKQQGNSGKNNPNKRKKSSPDKQRQQTSKKPKQDILQLFQKQKRNLSITEIILSDDSSDFVISTAPKKVSPKINNLELAEKTDFTDDAPKSNSWLSAVELVSAEMRSTVDRDDAGDIRCFESYNTTQKSSKLYSALRPSTPDLFDSGSETTELPSVANGAETPHKPEEAEENCQVNVDPYSLLFTSFSDTDNEIKSAHDDGTETVVEEFRCDLGIEARRNGTLGTAIEKQENARTPAKVVVLDGVRKQSTITSFFAGKGSKPVLSFVNDDAGASKTKTATKKMSSVDDAIKTSVVDNDIVKWDENTNRRSCPFYKKIPGTKFTVDAFSYGAIPGVEKYFLSHFHSDHYHGLNKHFRKPILCTQATANLVALKLRVNRSYLKVLPMNEVTIVDSVEVTPLEANHCPGSAMFVFYFPQSGQRILHTGDFRFHHSMTLYKPLQFKIHQIFLDTTYLNPSYNFPCQDKVIDFVRKVVAQEAKGKPRVLVVSGSYTIGKEKVFMAAAEVLGSQVWTSTEKHRVLNCLCESGLKERLTLQPTQARVHVLPMMKIGHSELRGHLDSHRTRFDQLVAFKPTGWTHTSGKTIEDIRPSVQGPIKIFSIPYSEHSSFTELEQFLKFLRPDKVIPTVNVGNASSRNKMNSYIQSWLKDAKR